MKGIRKYFNLENKPYYEICREERNLCALLYHLLLANPGNLQKFLELIGSKTKEPENAQIYVEFALLRDIWKEFGQSDLSLEEKNQRRRRFILSALDLEDHDQLKNCSVEKFNSVFISNPSKKEIQSPSRWSITRFDDLFPRGEKSEEGDQEFLRAARFKWCFNVKPDIVIFTSENEATSIEAKFESGEGKYPAGEKDKKRFRARNLSFVSQTKIQKQMFVMLDIKARHVLVTKKGDGHDGYSWKQVFEKLELGAELKFLRKQIDHALRR